MKFTKIFKQLVLATLLVSAFTANSQDIHFTQFWHTPFQISPGLTGSFDGDLRFHGNYRAQWSDVPVPWRTFYGAVDKSFRGKDCKKDNYFSAGLLLNHDKAGDSQMTVMQLGLNGAYNRRFSPRSNVSVGLQANAFQRSFDPELLRFSSQWDGKQYVSTLNNDEGDFYGQSQNQFYADFAAGANWRYEVDTTRTFFNLGAGWYHINRPIKSFDEDLEDGLPWRFTLHGMSVWQLRSKLDLLVDVIAQFQGPHRENLVNAAARYHLNLEKGKEVALVGGLAYRFNDGNNGRGDAIAPHIGLQLYNTWKFGLSYDINISDFKIATNNFGGPELSIIYIRRPVSAEALCPNCPVHF